MKRRTTDWPIVFAWAGFVLAIDAAIVWPMVQSAVASGQPTAQGVVTKCELVRVGKRSDKLHLAYTFEVAGREHTGTRYKHGVTFPRDRTWKEIHAELPVGTSVKVSYDPAAPGESAVLRPGVDPDNLWVLFPLAPFNILAAWMVYSWWSARGGRGVFDPARHVRPTADGFMVVLNGGRFWPNALIVAGGLCFAGFLLAIPLMEVVGWRPSAWGNVSLACGIVAGGVMFGRMWSRARRLYCDAEHVRLPMSSTGMRRLTIPRSCIRGVEVRSEARRSKSVRYEVFLLVLVWESEGATRETQFAEYRSAADADALAGWLGERLGVGG